MYTEKDRARFFAKVGVPNENGCRPWLGGHLSTGYGTFWVNGKTRGAHRVAWEIEHDLPFPEGLVGRHTCDWPPCVEATHIVSGTNADNSRDMSERGRGTFGDRNATHQPEWNLRGDMHPMAILTAERVTEIRARYALGDITQQALAELYLVSRAAISHALSGKNWSLVPGASKVRRKYIAVQGSSHGNSHLTEEMVIEMRRLRSQGSLVKDIAEQFNIAFSTAKNICAGRAWTHVAMPDYPSANTVNQYR